MTVLSAGQIAGYAEAAGFSGAQVPIAVAVALAESGGDPTAENHDSNGTTDYGLWQINSVHGYDPNQLLDPAFNAKAAYEVSGGGTHWTPWVTYNSGAYKQYLGQATGATPVPTSGAQPVSVWGDLNPKNWLGDLGHVMKDAVPGSIVTAFSDIGKLFANLISPHFWLRVGEMALGAFIVIIALSLIFRKQAVAGGNAAASSGLLKGGGAVDAAAMAA